MNGVALGGTGAPSTGNWGTRQTAPAVGWHNSLEQIAARGGPAGVGASGARAVMSDEAKASLTYLITGASGFLGYHLVRQLVEDGASVRIFDLNPPGFDRGFRRLVPPRCWPRPAHRHVRIVSSPRVWWLTPSLRTSRSE